MTATRDEIRDFLKECTEELMEEGALSAVLITHYAANGSETEVHSIRAGNKTWGDPDKMADVIDSISTRHARGIVGGGAQQYALAAIYGTEPAKQKRTLPFTRAAAMNTMNGLGSLATEPPNAMGRLAQEQRWGEEILRGTMRERELIITTLGTMVRDLHGALNTKEKQNAEMFLGYQKLLVDAADKQQETAIKVMVARRNAAMSLELFKMMPSLANAVSGTEIFPSGTADTSTLKAVLHLMTPETIEAIGKSADSGTPDQKAAFAIFMNRLSELKAQQAQEASKLKELQQQAFPDIDPELDAAGIVDPKSALTKIIDISGASDPKQLTNGTNGANGTNGVNGHHSNGRTNGHATAIVNDEDSDASEQLDRLLTAAGERVEFFLTMLGGADPDLAQRLRARAIKKGILK